MVQQERVEYAVRESLGNSFPSILATLVVSAIPGAVAYFFWMASSDDDGNLTRSIGFGVVAVVLALLMLLFVFVALRTLVRALRRSVVVKVERGGITLGSVGFVDRALFMPWSTVAGLRIYTTTRRTESSRRKEPTSVSTVWLQVDRTDGTSNRRVAPAGRDDSDDLVDTIFDVVRTVAPHVPIEDGGMLPEGEDPLTAP